LSHARNAGFTAPYSTDPGRGSLPHRTRASGDEAEADHRATYPDGWKPFNNRPTNRSWNRRRSRDCSNFSREAEKQSWRKAVYQAWITAEGKAFRDLKAERTRMYVSISGRETSQPSAARQDSETAFQTGIMVTGTVVHLSTRSATLPKLK